MTRETLKKANDYERQIYELNKFVQTCENCWNILWLQNKKFKIKTAYGCLDDEIKVSDELAERILTTIKSYADELEHELEDM